MGTGPPEVPRVSVIIPFLDPEPGFFQEAVASVFGQTLRSWELILVNDGSGRRATAQAEQHAAGDPARIRCISHAGGINRGIPASRNRGMEIARGEFLAFLDADDVWHPEKLEEQVALLEATPDAAMVFGRALVWRSWSDAGDGRRGNDHVPPLRVADGRVLPPGTYLRRMLAGTVLTPPPSGILVRAAAARALAGFETGVSNLYEDQAFYAKVGLHAGVLPCARVWIRYRVHPGSVIGAASRAEARRARRQYLAWLQGYLEQGGHMDAWFSRTLRVERWAATMPLGQRLVRAIRRASSPAVAEQGGSP
jgi:glycosyltransferase involved in cell wall biosynthesis